MTDQPNGMKPVPQAMPPGGVLPQVVPITIVPTAYDIQTAQGTDGNGTPRTLVHMVFWTQTGQQHYFFTQETARQFAQSVVAAATGLVVPRGPGGSPLS